MTTKHIACVAVATESSYGSISSTTGAPDKTALTFTDSTMEILDRAQLVTPGEPVLTERTDARCGFYGIPPEPATINDSLGAPIKRRRGTVTIDVPWRPKGDGSTFSDYADMPLQRILLTGFESVLANDTTADVIASSAGANTVVATTIADFATGQLVRWPNNGRLEYSAISDADVPTDTLTLSPAMSGALSGNLYPMRTNYIPGCGVPTTGSVALRMDGDGWRSYAYGCVLTQVVITMDEDSRMGRMSLTLDCAHIEDDHSNALVSIPDYADGHIVHQLESYLVVGTTGWTDKGGPTAQASESRATVCVDAFTLTVDIQRSANNCGESIIARNDNEITDMTATLEVTLGTTTDSYDEDLWDQRFRNVLLGFAGGTPDSVGEGGCIFMPAAFLTNDPSLREQGKDHNRTQLVWRAGPYGGDSSSTSAGNSILRIGMA